MPSDAPTLLQPRTRMPPFFIIEVALASRWYEVEEERMEYAWLIAGHSHQLVSSAIGTHPPMDTAAHLATTLGGMFTRNAALTQR